MKKQNYLFVTCFFILFSAFSLTAQNSLSRIELDSLWKVWNNPEHDVRERTEALSQLSWDGYLRTVPDSSIILSRLLRKFAEENKNFDLATDALNTEATAWYLKGDLKRAVKVYEVAIKYATLHRSSTLKNVLIGNLAIVLQELGDHVKALEYYMKDLAYCEKKRDSMLISGVKTNIATVFIEMGDTASAMMYYNSSYEIALALNIKEDIIINSLNIGDVYHKSGNIAASLRWFYRADSVSQGYDNNFYKANIQIMIGEALIEKKELVEAERAITFGLNLSESIDDTQGQTRALTGLAKIKLRQSNFAEGIQFANRAFQLSSETGAVKDRLEAIKVLHLLHRASGSFRQAIEMLDMQVALRDSILSVDNQRGVMRTQMQYDFDKKEALLAAEQEKKEALAKEEIRRKNIQRNASVGVLLLLILLAGSIYRGKKKSDELLLNILPYETAQELKKKGTSDAVLINQVTVLFTDFKGFTALSEKLAPKELVKDLHECFSAFDRICGKYGIEKIKTIGDAYMAAGGLPTPNLTHAKDVVKAALEIAEFVEVGKKLKIEKGEPFFEIRVGVHTGPVVAGIVGIKKFQYDIWGDTVNTASRMESSGAVGKVNVSQSTYEQIKDEFTCEYRGEIEAKGKGKLGMYFVDEAKFSSKSETQ